MTDDPTKRTPVFGEEAFLDSIERRIGTMVDHKLDGLRGDLRRDVEALRTECREDNKGLRDIIKQNADVSIASHEAHRKRVRRLTSFSKTMWIKMFGSEPPPPADGGDEEFEMTEPATDPSSRKIIPLDRQVTDHDHTLAGVQGQLIALSSQRNEDKRLLDELLELQKKQMGIRPEATKDRPVVQRVLDGVGRLFTERSSQKFALTLLAALGSFITALGTTYALATGRLPYPNSPPPVPPMLHAGPTLEYRSQDVGPLPPPAGREAARPSAAPPGQAESSAPPGGGAR